MGAAGTALIAVGMLVRFQPTRRRGVLTAKKAFFVDNYYPFGEYRANLGPPTKRGSILPPSRSTLLTTTNPLWVDDHQGAPHQAGPQAGTREAGCAK